MQAPWYFGAETATLRHQRQQEEKLPEYAPLGISFKKGLKEVSFFFSFYSLLLLLFLTGRFHENTVHYVMFYSDLFYICLLVQQILRLQQVSSVISCCLRLPSLGNDCTIVVISRDHESKLTTP